MEVDEERMPHRALGHRSVSRDHRPLLLRVEAVAVGSAGNLVEHAHLYQAAGLVNDHTNLDEVARPQLGDVSHLLSAS